jgi:hypothetical protein
MTSTCVPCNTGQPVKPSGPLRKRVARYRCPVKGCRARWYVCWNTASLEKVA